MESSMESLESDPKIGNRWFGSPKKMMGTCDDNDNQKLVQFSLCSEYSVGDTLKRYRSRDNSGGKFAGKTGKHKGTSMGKFSYVSDPEKLKKTLRGTEPQADTIMDDAASKTTTDAASSAQPAEPTQPFQNPVMDEEEKPCNITGLFTGALVGFGMGLCLAMPFWYSIAGGGSPCYNAWKVKY